MRFRAFAMTAAIMLQGTGSDVGKSVLVAGLCRLARRRGLNVVPFKPQNMSNNAAVASDRSGGFGEIGRAQWLQALACDREPTVDMNPVLLKPQSERGSQVVVRGRVVGQASGRDYLDLKSRLLGEVMSSFATLGREADLVIVEGAGSPAEVNLRRGDVANMGFATAANVPVVLVGDIDRGGVIASLVGTHAILPEPDRDMVRGFLINKFRGDVRLFDDGLSIIAERTGWPCLGVVPWLAAAGRLPAEDSVALERLSSPRTRIGGSLRIAVPILGRTANFDDLDPLSAESACDVTWIREGGDIPADTNVVIIPGSKSTIADLNRLRENGWDDQIRGAHERGAQIIGLCGGYQILGKLIDDPQGVEGGGTADGLGLLAVRTVMGPAKTTKPIQARSTRFDVPVDGYEIHMGRTTGRDTKRAPFVTESGPDGAASADGRVWGTYIHGVFGDGDFRGAWLASHGVHSDGGHHRDRIVRTLDELAGELEPVVDFNAMLKLAEERRAESC